MLANQAIYIGVDGGATKTHIRVEDDSGQCLGEACSGPANIQHSVVGSWASIMNGLAQAISHSGRSMDDPSLRLQVGMGLAGTELPNAVHAFLATPHPFATLVLRSDAHTACLGAHGGEDGAVIAIGTGTVGYSIQGHNTQQVGGWGFPHGDEGGGAWLGLEALRLTLHWLDGRRGSSPLLEAIFAHFHHNQSALLSWANQASATEFAQLAPTVLTAADDPLAAHLLQRAARHIETMATALGVPGALPCSLLGGLAMPLETWLSEPLHSALRPPRGDGVQGALLMIRQAVKDGTDHD